MGKKILYQIRNGVNWRKETGIFMLLHPKTKKLYFFDKKISTSVSNEGILHENKSNQKTIRFLINDRIIQEIKSPSEIERDFTDKKLSGPLNATIQITDKCNLNCVHCHRDSKNTNTIDLPTFKVLVSELRKLNVFNINISGGEPLLVPELVEMVRDIDRKGMKITMSTNGLLLDANIVKKLYAAGLKQIQLSVDSSDSGIHNVIRRSKNSFKQLMKNIPILIQNDIIFTIVTTLIDQTPEDYAKIIDLAYSLGASAHKTNTLIPSDNNLNNLSKLRSFRLISEFINIWKKKKRQYEGKMALMAETMFNIQLGEKYLNPPEAPELVKIGCPAGVLTCAINQKGDVLPCPFFSQISFGNIYQKSFRKIWDNEEMKQFRERKNFNICGYCKNKENCGGCRARSFAIYKKLYQTDPFCFRKIANKKYGRTHNIQ